MINTRPYLSLLSYSIQRYWIQELNWWYWIQELNIFTLRLTPQYPRLTEQVSSISSSQWEFRIYNSTQLISCSLRLTAITVALPLIRSTYLTIKSPYLY